MFIEVPPLFYLHRLANFHLFLWKAVIITNYFQMDRGLYMVHLEIIDFFSHPSPCVQVVCF